MTRTRNRSLIRRLTAAVSPANGPITHAAIDRWALLVGISDYANRGLALKYAHRDAHRLREVLLQPTAGSFAADHVLVLTDAQATLAGLTKALRTFLKRPARDDLVLLFFACHGSHDPERPTNLYLLPHDADPLDISGTALPMREIDLALKETLVSQRVVVLMDSCHSGGVAGALGGLRANDAAAADFNRYMGELSEARGGVSLLTSAMANESSIEGEQWGQGHGVFTHYLLEGLKGKADRLPRDGVVTVGELFDYVTEQVKLATGDRQHPHISGSSDRELVLAVMGASTAEQHLELAAHLAGAAEWLNEPVCWLGAAAQWQQAQQLRAEGEDVSLATATALALARGGDLDAAEVQLRALPRDGDGVRAMLGLAELAQGRVDDARATLLAPTAPAPWVPQLFSTPLVRARRIALLVALDSVDPAHYAGWSGPLKSPVAETREFGARLQAQFGFDEIVWLLGRHATADALRQALRELVARSRQLESLVVLLSGHGGELPAAAAPRGVDGTFVAYDAQVTSAEIDAVLRSSRAGRTTLVASMAHSGHFVDRAKAGGYEAMTSCAANQVDMDGEKFGAFMEALFAHMRPDGNGESLAAAMRHFVKKLGMAQVPQFELAGNEPPFIGRRGSAVTLPAVELARTLLGVGTAAAGDDLLGAALDFTTQHGAPAEFTGVLVSHAWQRARLEGQVAAMLPVSGASTAQLCANLCAAARQSSPQPCAAALERLALHPHIASDDALLGSVKAVAVDVARGGALATRVRVLLVGLGGDVGAGGMPSAIDNVTAVRAALLAAGVTERNMVRLTNADATFPAMRAAMRRLAGRTLQHPALVYWCGRGVLSALQCHDGKAFAHDELVGWLGNAVTLLADGIDDNAPPHQRGASAPPPITVLLRRRGPRGEVAGTVWRERLDNRAGKARYAPVALALVDALRARGNDLATLRGADVERAGRSRVVQSRAGDGRLVTDPLVARVDALAKQVRYAELARAAARLDTWLELRGGGDGMVQLQLGVLRDALDQSAVALAALERSVALLAAQPLEQAQARLMLGRVLLASGSDRARAVSECRIASELDPRLDAALFWLGRAIADLIRRETMTQASDALMAYLSRGAPIGHRDEAQRLLQQLGGIAAREWTN